jgi:hypothetical protein
LATCGAALITSLQGTVLNTVHQPAAIPAPHQSLYS